MSPLFRVDLLTRVLEVEMCPGSIAEIATLHLEHGRNLLLAVTEKYGAQYASVPRLGDEDLQIVAKLEHELDHLRRVSGTSFGQLLAALQARLVNTTMSRDLWSGDLFVEAPPLGQDDRVALKAASDVMNAVFVLLGDSPVPAAYSDSATDQAVRSIQSLGGGAELSLKPRRCNAFMPAVKTSRGPRVLGAQALLEYMAVSQEASHLGFSLGRRAVPIEFYAGQSTYSLVGSVWRDGHQLPMINAEATSWGPGKESLSGPRFPAELKAAIDLALWVPFGPEGWLEGMTWCDVHPGWRFLIILDRIKEMQTGVSPHSFNLSMSDDDFDSLQTEWAEFLGWPTPRRLCEQWLSAMEKLNDEYNTGKEVSRFWTIGDDSWRWRADADHLRTKLLHPGLSVTTRPETDGHEHLWFQSIFIENMEESCVDIYRPPTHEQECSKLGYCFAPSISLQLVSEGMLKRASQPNGLLPDRLQRLFSEFGGHMFRDCRTYRRRHGLAE